MQRSFTREHGLTYSVRQGLGDLYPEHPMEQLAASASLHPLPGIPQGVGTTEIAGEGKDRQSGARSR